MQTSMMMTTIFSDDIHTMGGGLCARCSFSSKEYYMDKIETLSIDLETRSSVDLSKCGTYRYAESPDFEILLFGYSVNGGEVNVVDLACGEKVPDEILAALADNSVIKTAFNSSFERVCLSYWLHRYYPNLLDRDFLDPAGWRCSMVLSLYNGLPGSLDKVGSVLGFEQQKLKEGKELIRYFCVPSRTASRDWNLPEHAPERWETFKRYNKRDVEVELQIQERLRNYPVPDSVWAEYFQDQEINDRGIMIDRELVKQAVRIDALTKDSLTATLKEKTGLENPNSVIQMKKYLAERGMAVETLGKKDVQEMIKTAPEDLAEVLALRLQLAKSSVKKYQAMQNSVCEDGRCRGMFRFYGANRTGRFSGARIQLQNLYRNSMPDLEEARALVKAGDFEMLSMLYDNVPEVLAELVRTAFVPRLGYKFIVADFSAIEARVLAYLAGEQWVLDVFHNGGDIYCATASRMFGVPVEKHGQNADLRQKGKQATLSCGYQGSVGALRAMGALEAGMKEEELQPLVNAWREANPNIVRFWWNLDTAVKNTLKKHNTTKVGCLTIEARNGMLFIHLPSGRRLSYVKPQMGINRFGSESVTYMGIDATKHWSRIESSPGKWAENITQAVSRDILTYAMQTLKDYRIVAHVHDELIIECPPKVSVESICEQMGRTPPWLPGLELRADGYECSFYMKA